MRGNAFGIEGTTADKPPVAQKERKGPAEEFPETGGGNLSHLNRKGKGKREATFLVKK